ncbi:MAG: histidine phosphatase family protein [Oscillospiraceae bacterium]
MDYAVKGDERLYTMTRVYIIRHAEAEGNLYRRIHGHYNSNLTVLGIKQLDALEKRFAGIHIDRVYSSDLTRAKMTSTAITRSRSMSPVLLPSLREAAMGVWEDLEWGYAAKFEPEQYKYFNDDPARWSIDGSEPFEETQDRMLRTLIEKARENDGRTIAMFSHGCAIRCLTAKLTGTASGRISDIPYCDNTAVMTLDISGDNIDILSSRDSSHLTDGLIRPRLKKGGGDFSSNLYFEITSSPDIPHELKTASIEDCGVYEAFDIDESVGFVSVDTLSLSKEKTGLLSLCYLKPEYRGGGRFAQLIGKAVSLSRRAGLSRLAVIPGAEADKFAHYGFIPLSGSGLSCAYAMDISRRSL